MQFSTQISSVDWRSDADGLRGVAILAVLIFHAVPSWLPGGFLGVDLFFVLSGFFVGHRMFDDLANNRFSYSLFYARRAKRLFPALIAVLIGTMVAASFLVGDHEYRELGQQAAAATIFMANFLAWAQSGYFEVDAEYKALLHLWSLGVEEQFYLVFPIALVSIWHRGREHVGKFMLVATVISFGCCVAVTHWDHKLAFYFPVTRLWEFLVGAQLAWRERKYITRLRNIQTRVFSCRLVEIYSVIGLIVLLSAFFLMHESSAFPGWDAAAPVVGAIFLLAAGQETWIGREVLSGKFLRWMGKISYAAYLWHWPILVLARYQSGAALTPLLSISLTMLSIIFAAISTRFIEAPFRTGSWSHYPQIGRILWLSTATIGISAILTTTIFGARTTDVGDTATLSMLDHYPMPRDDLWRESANCFVNVNQELPFGSDCLGGGINEQPLAVLWGDSHAAHLWPGLAKQASSHGWQLAQLTVSQCPPLTKSVGELNPKCAAMRQRAIDTIRRLKPETVILASRWTFYNHALVLEQIPPTVQFLNSLGIRNVFVVGPVPRWVPSLSAALARDMRLHRLTKPPLHTTTGFDEQVFTMNNDLQIATSGTNATFISALSVLCDEHRKCKAWVDDDQYDTLMAFDAAHLTPQGSEWLASRLSNTIFPQTRY